MLSILKRSDITSTVVIQFLDLRTEMEAYVQHNRLEALRQRFVCGGFERILIGMRKYWHKILHFPHIWRLKLLKISQLHVI